jgi:hypothetical protein
MHLTFGIYSDCLTLFSAACFSVNKIDYADNYKIRQYDEVKYAVLSKFTDVEI